MARTTGRRTGSHWLVKSQHDPYASCMVASSLSLTIGVWFTWTVAGRVRTTLSTRAILSGLTFALSAQGDCSRGRASLSSRVATVLSFLWHELSICCAVGRSCCHPLLVQGATVLRSRT